MLEIHGKYIILCNFGGHFLSDFEVIEGAPDFPPGPREQKQKNPVWIGLNTRV